MFSVSRGLLYTILLLPCVSFEAAHSQDMGKQISTLRAPRDITMDWEYSVVHPGRAHQSGGEAKVNLSLHDASDIFSSTEDKVVKTTFVYKDNRSYHITREQGGSTYLFLGDVLQTSDLKWMPLLPFNIGNIQWVNEAKVVKSTGDNLLVSGYCPWLFAPKIDGTPYYNSAEISAVSVGPNIRIDKVVLLSNNEPAYIYNYEGQLLLGSVFMPKHITCKEMSRGKAVTIQIWDLKKYENKSVFDSNFKVENFLSDKTAISFNVDKKKLGLVYLKSKGDLLQQINEADLTSKSANAPAKQPNVNKFSFFVIIGIMFICISFVVLRRRQAGG